MRHAPSVIHPVGRSSFQATLLLLLAVAALMLIFAWYVLVEDNARRWMGAGPAFVVWSLWCLWAYRVWWRSPVGRLEWRAGSDDDPQEAGWYWHAATRDTGLPLEGDPVQALVLSRVVLIRFPGLWLWLEEASGSRTWWPLRRALKACQGRR
ncbi:MAG: hypothetical protein ACLGG8_06425 [Gammaproteobacteria bacterium]